MSSEHGLHRDEAPPRAPWVVAVVVTYNRKAMLLECLEALARQTHPLGEVVVVDNASTDGTEELLEDSGIGARLPVLYLRLTRNGGGAEGFHYGIRTALEQGRADWVWLMDDDCEPEPPALAQLLASAPASKPDCAVLAPKVLSADRELLPLNCGSLRSSWFLAPFVALAPERYEEDAVEIEFCSFVGPLVRARAARAAGLPLRQAFIRLEDIEYMLRMRGRQRQWTVPGSVVLHKDPRPITSARSLARWRDYVRRTPFTAEWKHLFGVRNTIFLGRRHGLMTASQALAYAFAQTVRVLAFGERRLRQFHVACVYAYDGWRGVFRNVPPEAWPGLAEARDPLRYISEHALRYDVDVAGAVRRLRSAADPPHGGDRHAGVVLEDRADAPG